MQIWCLRRRRTQTIPGKPNFGPLLPFAAFFQKSFKLFFVILREGFAWATFFDSSKPYFWQICFFTTRKNQGFFLHVSSRVVLRSSFFPLFALGGHNWVRVKCGKKERNEWEKRKSLSSFVNHHICLFFVVGNQCRCEFRMRASLMCGKQWHVGEIMDTNDESRVWCLHSKKNSFDLASFEIVRPSLVRIISVVSRKSFSGQLQLLALYRSPQKASFSVPRRREEKKTQPPISHSLCLKSRKSQVAKKFLSSSPFFFRHLLFFPFSPRLLQRKLLSRESGASRRKRQKIK